MTRRRRHNLCPRCHRPRRQPLLTTSGKLFTFPRKLVLPTGLRGMMLAAGTALCCCCTDGIITPESDISLGFWTDDGGGTTDVFQAINEWPASDTDYAKSPFTIDPVKSFSRFQSSVTDNGGTDMKIEFRAKIKVLTGSITDGFIQVMFAQAGIGDAGPITAQWTVIGDDVWTDFSQTFSGQIAPPITDPEITMQSWVSAVVATGEFQVSAVRCTQLCP